MSARALIVKGQVGIARPPQEVYDVLADPAAWFALDDALVDVTPRAALTPGMTGTMRRRAGLGLTLTTAWENTELTPGSSIENLITGFGYELREKVTLTADPLGTQVAVVDELIPTSLVGRAMVAMSRRFLQRDLGARFERLKETVEAPPATKS